MALRSRKQYDQNHLCQIPSTFSISGASPSIQESSEYYFNSEDKPSVRKTRKTAYINHANVDILLQKPAVDISSLLHDVLHNMHLSTEGKEDNDNSLGSNAASNQSLFGTSSSSNNKEKAPEMIASKFLVALLSYPNHLLSITHTACEALIYYGLSTNVKTSIKIMVYQVLSCGITSSDQGLAGNKKTKGNQFNQSFDNSEEVGKKKISLGDQLMDSFFQNAMNDIQSADVELIIASLKTVFLIVKDSQLLALLGNDKMIDLLKQCIRHDEKTVQQVTIEIIGRILPRILYILSTTDDRIEANSFSSLEYRNTSKFMVNQNNLSGTFSSQIDIRSFLQDKKDIILDLCKSILNILVNIDSLQANESILAASILALNNILDCSTLSILEEECSSFLDYQTSFSYNASEGEKQKTALKMKSLIVCGQNGSGAEYAIGDENILNLESRLRFIFHPDVLDLMNNLHKMLLPRLQVLILRFIRFPDTYKITLCQLINKVAFYGLITSTDKYGRHQSIDSELASSNKEFIDPFSSSDFDEMAISSNIYMTRSQMNSSLYKNPNGLVSKSILQLVLEFLGIYGCQSSSSLLGLIRNGSTTNIQLKVTACIGALELLLLPCLRIYRNQFCIPMIRVFLTAIREQQIRSISSINHYFNNFQIKLVAYVILTLKWLPTEALPVYLPQVLQIIGCIKQPHIRCSMLQEVVILLLIDVQHNGKIHELWFIQRFLDDPWLSTCINLQVANYEDNGPNNTSEGAMLNDLDFGSHGEGEDFSVAEDEGIVEGFDQAGFTRHHQSLKPELILDYDKDLVHNEMNVQLRQDFFLILFRTLMKLIPITLMPNNFIDPSIEVEIRNAINDRFHQVVSSAQNVGKDLDLYERGTNCETDDTESREKGNLSSNNGFAEGKKEITEKERLKQLYYNFFLNSFGRIDSVAKTPGYIFHFHTNRTPIGVNENDEEKNLDQNDVSEIEIPFEKNVSFWQRNAGSLLHITVFILSRLSCCVNWDDSKNSGGDPSSSHVNLFTPFSSYLSLLSTICRFIFGRKCIDLNSSPEAKGNNISSEQEKDFHGRTSTSRSETDISSADSGDIYQEKNTLKRYQVTLPPSEHEEIKMLLRGVLLDLYHYKMPSGIDNLYRLQILNLISYYPEYFSTDGASKLYSLNEEEDTRIVLNEDDLNKSETDAFDFIKTVRKDLKISDAWSQYNHSALLSSATSGIFGSPFLCKKPDINSSIDGHTWRNICLLTCLHQVAMNVPTIPVIDFIVISLEELKEEAIKSGGLNASFIVDLVHLLMLRIRMYDPRFNKYLKEEGQNEENIPFNSTFKPIIEGRVTQVSDSFMIKDLWRDTPLLFPLIRPDGILHIEKDLSSHIVFSRLTSSSSRFNKFLSTDRAYEKSSVNAAKTKVLGDIRNASEQMYSRKLPISSITDDNDKKEITISPLPITGSSDPLYITATHSANANNNFVYIHLNIYNASNVRLKQFSISLINHSPHRARITLSQSSTITFSNNQESDTTNVLQPGACFQCGFMLKFLTLGDMKVSFRVKVEGLEGDNDEYFDVDAMAAAERLVQDRASSNKRITNTTTAMQNLGLSDFYLRKKLLPSTATFNTDSLRLSFTSFFLPPLDYQKTLPSFQETFTSLAHAFIIPVGSNINMINALGKIGINLNEYSIIELMNCVPLFLSKHNYDNNNKSLPVPSHLLSFSTLSSMSNLLLPSNMTTVTGFDSSLCALREACRVANPVFDNQLKRTDIEAFLDFYNDSFVFKTWNGSLITAILTGRKLFTRNEAAFGSKATDDKSKLTGNNIRETSNKIPGKNQSFCWKGRIELRSNDLSVFEDLFSSTENIATFVSFLTNGLFTPLSSTHKETNLLGNNSVSDKAKRIENSVENVSREFSGFHDSNTYYRDPVFDLVFPTSHGEPILQKDDNTIFGTVVPVPDIIPRAPKIPPQQTSTTLSTPEDIISRWKKTYNIRQQLKVALKE